MSVGSVLLENLSGQRGITLKHPGDFTWNHDSHTPGDGLLTIGIHPHPQLIGVGVNCSCVPIEAQAPAPTETIRQSSKPARSHRPLNNRARRSNSSRSLDHSVLPVLRYHDGNEDRPVLAARSENPGVVIQVLMSATFDVA